MRGGVILSRGRRRLCRTYLVEAGEGGGGRGRGGGDGEWVSASEPSRHNFFYVSHCTQTTAHTKLINAFGNGIGELRHARIRHSILVRLSGVDTALPNLTALVCIHCSETEGGMNPNTETPKLTCHTGTTPTTCPLPFQGTH